jgi:hypothetical protein
MLWRIPAEAALLLSAPSGHSSVLAALETLVKTWEVQLLRLASLALVPILSAHPSYSCPASRPVTLLDFLNGDVVIAANIVAYEPDSARNTAMLKLQTRETLEGFHKVDWLVGYQPSQSYVPDVNIWSGPVLIALRGRVADDGTFSATIVKKQCAAVLIFPTDREPGKSLRANLKKLRL